MKGQTQIMSAVLLTGIMVGLMGIAYVWGGPMIQKQKDVVKLDNMESFMQNLNQEIKNVAKNGGTSRLKVELPGKLEIVNGGSLGNGTVDSVTLEFETQGTVIQPGTDIVLIGNDKNKVRPIGSEAGVIVERAKKIDDKYHITLELFFRELVGSGDTYIIDLAPSRRTQIGSVGSGSIDRAIVISNMESKTDNNAGTGNKDLHRNKVQIKI